MDNHAQDKADRNLDKKKKPKNKKKIPLIEREFNELISLEDQLRWLELKRKQKDKKLFN